MFMHAPLINARPAVEARLRRCGHPARCPTRRTLRVAAVVPVAHFGADALGDRVEEGFTDVAVEPPVSDVERGDSAKPVPSNH